MDRLSIPASSRISSTPDTPSTISPVSSTVPSASGEDPEFRIEVADAIPLRAPNRAQHTRRRPLPIARQRLRDEQQVMHDALHDPFDWDAAVATGNELLFVRPGVPNAALRKLKRGGWVLRAELDLHGMTGDESRLALSTFLHDCNRRELRCVRIIHGKGTGALRETVHACLRRSDKVEHFSLGNEHSGGWGATMVALRPTPMGKR